MKKMLPGAWSESKHRTKMVIASVLFVSAVFISSAVADGSTPKTNGSTKGDAENEINVDDILAKIKEDVRSSGIEEDDSTRLSQRGMKVNTADNTLKYRTDSVYGDEQDHEDEDINQMIDELQNMIMHNMENNRETHSRDSMEGDDEESEEEVEKPKEYFIIKKSRKKEEEDLGLFGLIGSTIMSTTKMAWRTAKQAYRWVNDGGYLYV